jgi:hypothetical protein
MDEGPRARHRADIEEDAVEDVPADAPDSVGDDVEEDIQVHVTRRTRAAVAVGAVIWAVALVMLLRSQLDLRLVAPVWVLILLILMALGRRWYGPEQTAAFTQAWGHRASGRLHDGAPRWWVLLVVATFVAFLVALWTGLQWLVGIDWVPARAVITALVVVSGVGYAWILISPPQKARTQIQNETFVVALIRAALTAIVAAAAFAALTHALIDWDLVDFDDDADGTGLMTFYTWHLANAVPGHAVQALQWEAPYTYHQARVGILVIAYTLVVVGPILRYLGRTFQKFQASGGLDAQRGSSEPTAGEVV